MPHIKNWLDAAWQQFTKFKVQGNCSKYQGPNDPCPFEIWSSLCCLCWLWCVLMWESKFSWINLWSPMVHMMELVCTSVCFLLSSSFCGNGNVRAAILHIYMVLRLLECRKMSLQVSMWLACWTALFVLCGWCFFQCCHHLEDKCVCGEEGGSLLIRHMGPEILMQAYTLSNHSTWDNSTLICNNVHLCKPTWSAQHTFFWLHTIMACIVEKKTYPYIPCLVTLLKWLTKQVRHKQQKS